MTSRDLAVMAMIFASALGLWLSDGELQRIRWIRAMRRCVLRMNNMILYEHPSLAELLQGVDLRSTSQERGITRMLHACAEQMEKNGGAEILETFLSESVKITGYGLLSAEDRLAFEGMLNELGRTRLAEQLELIRLVDERLRAREETLNLESQRRAKLIRTLGFCSGAALFLILI